MLQEYTYNVYLDREIYIFRERESFHDGQQPCGGPGQPLPLVKGRFACLGPEVGEDT